MDLLRWIRNQHRRIGDTFESGVRSMLTPDQMLERPHGTNSVAWLVWHLARIEDVIVQRIALGQPEVYANGWGERVGFGDTRMGTGFSDEEVTGFGETADVAALVDYWTEVRNKTAEWLNAIDESALDAVPDLESSIGSGPQLTSHLDETIIQAWSGRPVGWLLNGSVIIHGFLHLGEMFAVRGLLGAKGML